MLPPLPCCSPFPGAEAAALSGLSPSTQTCPLGTSARGALRGKNDAADNDGGEEEAAEEEEDEPGAAGLPPLPPAASRAAAGATQSPSKATSRLIRVLCGSSRELPRDGEKEKGKRGDRGEQATERKREEKNSKLKKTRKLKTCSLLFLTVSRPRPLACTAASWPRACRRARCHRPRARLRAARAAGCLLGLLLLGAEEEAEEASSRSTARSGDSSASGHRRRPRRRPLSSPPRLLRARAASGPWSRP